MSVVVERGFEGPPHSSDVRPWAVIEAFRAVYPALEPLTPGERTRVLAGLGVIYQDDPAAAAPPPRKPTPDTIKARVLALVDSLGRDVTAEELAPYLDPPVEVATLRTTLWKLAEVDRVLGRGAHGIYRPLESRGTENGQ